MKNLETLYRLPDGTQADPKDCSVGKDGVLRHKNGLAVVLDEHGEPQTIGDAAIANKNVEAAEAGKPEDAVKASPPATGPASPRVADDDKPERPTPPAGEAENR